MVSFFCQKSDVFFTHPAKNRLLLAGPPNPDSNIGGAGAEVVAWYPQTGHGTRLITLAAFQGAQLLKTSAYIRTAGFID